MGERKVLNKYYPPDFDPKKVPRMKRDPEKQIGVRMMIPFSMQCNTCGEFMYRGKKFNSLKEDCIGEDYLTITRFRFYIKCVICSQEITFKTDPEKGDYALESGASRNFESWTDKQATEEEHKKAREEEEKSDNMKQLENRTLDSKIELEIMDALDEIKAVNRRQETVDTAEVLKASAARREKGSAALVGGAGSGAGEGEQDEDDAIIANIQFGGPKVHRLAEAEDSDGWGSGGSSGDVNQDKMPRGVVKGSSAKGKGKKTTSGGSEGEPKSEPVRISVGGDDEEDGAGTRTTRDGANASLPVSKVQAQAAREAEDEAKLAAAGSMGTKVVVKKRKKNKGDSRDKGGDNSRKSCTAPGDDSSKSKKKHKSKGTKKSIKADGGNTGVGVTIASVAAPVGGGAAVGALGGLNLLGSYDSSSASDNDAL